MSVAEICADLKAKEKRPFSIINKCNKDISFIPH